MNYFEGVVSEIRFRNNENDYTVLVLRTENGPVLVSGCFPGIDLGFLLNVEGEYKQNPKYGDYLSPSRWQTYLPQDDNGIRILLNVLISGKYFILKPVDDPLCENLYGEELFSVISEIVNRYHSSVYDVIENDKESLREIHRDLLPGAKFDIVPDILSDSLNERRYLLEVVSILAGIDTKLVQYAKPMITTVNTIHDLHETGDVIHYLQNNPYVFCDFMDEYAFEFPQADQIAKHFNLPMDSYERCRAGILYCMKKKIMNDGHVYAKPEELLSVAFEVLALSEELLIAKIHDMISNGILVNDLFADVPAIYLQDYYEMECTIAEKLTDMNQRNRGNAVIYPDFAAINEMIHLTLDEQQQEAVSTAVNSPITIITGGPGTGKTTIIRGVIAALHNNGINSISLAAPTGRAALRMSEASGMEAQTIHRMLGITPFSTRNDVSPISYDVVIIDEVSMIDIDLMDKLVHALEEHVKLILVGDVDQLPSVGPGYVLHDMIESGRFSVVKLRQTHRQETERSSIIENASRVLHGEMIEIEDSPDTDLVFEQTNDRKETEDRICQIISSILENEPEAINSIQVLCPKYADAAGVFSLNKRIQALVNHNPDTFETYNNEIIKSHDRVMITQNDYKHNIFNGEISEDSTVSRDNQRGNCRLNLFFYGNRTSGYAERGTETKWLTLAYAITVHKSQGSEYSYVIMPIYHSRNLYRNTIYTAMTRAKRRLFMVGTLEDLRKGIDNVDPVIRNSKLKERIQQAEAE